MQTRQQIFRVASSDGVVLRHLREGHRAGGNGLVGELSGVEGGVAGMQQPVPGLELDEDSGVPSAMAGQREKPDSGVDALRCEGGAALPEFSGRGLRRPAGPVLPLRESVRISMGQRLDAPLRLGERMYARAREVGETADVVTMVMGQENVANVGRVVSQGFDLTDERFRWVEAGSRQREPVVAEATAGIGDVVEADPGIDRDKALASVDEERPADHEGGAPHRRAVLGIDGARVELVDDHDRHGKISGRPEVKTPNGRTTQ